MATVSGGVPLMDFSAIGQLPDKFREGRKAAREDRVLKNREVALADLGRGATWEDVGRRLFAAGDIEGGLSLAKLGDAIEQRKFNQGIAERQIKLQEHQARDKPQFMQVEGPDGGKRLVRVTPDGGASAVNVPGMDNQPGNPFLTGKSGTEGQQNAQLYANRMLNAERVLQDQKIVEAATDWGQRVRANPPIPLIGAGGRQAVGNFLTSTEYQKFDQAQRDFINAVLRRESGAVISEQEFDNARKQYFPQPGDAPEKIEQKRQNRLEAIKGIGAAGGPGYRPQQMIGPGGKIAPAPQRGAAPKLPEGYTPQRALDEARQAIAGGKNRDLVIKRLQEIGIDPAGL